MAESLKSQWEKIKREQRKTVADLSRECKKRSVIQRGFSEQNLGELIYDTEGKSPEIKKLIQVVFDEWTGATKSVVQGRTDSVAPGLELRDEGGEYKTANEWKAEAYKLREENSRLRAAIQLLAAPQTPLSSAASAKADQLAREILKRAKSGSQSGAAGSDSKAA